MGLPVSQEGLANALVDGVDRRFIGHGTIVSKRVAVPWRPTGNDQKQSHRLAESRCLTKAGVVVQQVQTSS